MSKFWKESTITKINYLVQHVKRTHEKYNIRQVQVDRIIELSQKLLEDDLIAYFETLPSNYKKAFKSAWRQKEHKTLSSKRTIEVSGASNIFIQRIVKLHKHVSGSDKSKLELTEDALVEAYFAMVEKHGLDPRWDYDVTK